MHHDRLRLHIAHRRKLQKKKKKNKSQLTIGNRAKKRNEIGYRVRDSTVISSLPTLAVATLSAGGNPTLECKASPSISASEDRIEVGEMKFEYGYGYGFEGT